MEDTGIRDENGLESMDHLFSSPEKSTRRMNGNGINADTTISSEEDMEMVDSMPFNLLCSNGSKILMSIRQSSGT